MSKRNAQAVNYARHRMIDAVDLLNEAILTLQSKEGPGDPNTVTITITREAAKEILGSEYGCSECNGIAEPIIAAIRSTLKEERRN